MVEWRDLLPIPDELIRLVAAKQFSELHYLFAAIPNRALPKQARLPMRFLCHPELCFRCGHIGLGDDLYPQAVEDIRVAAAVAVDAAFPAIGQFEVDGDILHASERLVCMHNRVWAVGGGDLGEFLEGHGQLLLSLCGIHAAVWYEYSIAAMAQQQVYTAISQCVIPILPQRAAVAITWEMAEMTINRQSEKAGRPKTPQAAPPLTGRSLCQRSQPRHQRDLRR